MSEIVDRAIQVSEQSLHKNYALESVACAHEVPPSVRYFFERIQCGLLFPVTDSVSGEVFGFEISGDRLQHSVNELIGNPPVTGQPVDYFDRCYVLFHSAVDSSYAVCIDLNDRHAGWIFLTQLGHNPHERSEYQAKSFEDWLELNLRTYSRDDPERWTMRDIPKLGIVGDG
jgi:hypothetical protein